MPQYLSPGVYVEEVEAGSAPSRASARPSPHSSASPRSGPANTPTLVTNWSQFTQTFGDFMEGSYLAHAVYGYFLNGGGACYVVRVGADGAMPAAQAQLGSAKDKATAAYRATALEAGPGGNDITIDIQPSSETSESSFKLVVNQGGKPIEVFDNVTSARARTTS